MSVHYGYLVEHVRIESMGNHYGSPEQVKSAEEQIKTQHISFLFRMK